jgi:hypothetical protein
MLTGLYAAVLMLAPFVAGSLAVLCVGVAAYAGYLELRDAIRARQASTVLAGLSKAVAE